MELGLSLGLNSSGVENQEEEKLQVSQEINDDEASDGSDDNNNNQDENTNLQLNLLPLAPVQRLQSLPWSSDNGSSENGSSGNQQATRGFDVNKFPVGSTDEVSSANSIGSSPFRMDFGIYRTTVNRNLLNGNKRDFEAIRNDVVEAERASSRASDDDENALNARKKLRLSKEQSAFLEESFKEHNTLNPKQKLALAKQLNLRPRQVEVWFQNRRARTKLKQTEVDCEYLKRCCDTLTEQNKRLQKELQDLRALKTTNPYLMQLPATTLTMCPSCERVATTSTVVPPLPAVKVDTVDSNQKAFPFPLITRPRFYPFSQNSNNHPNKSAAS